MISFKEYLAERADYPLYHATDIDSLKKMIVEGVWRTGMESDYHKGVSKDGRIISLTRDFNFATRWIRGILSMGKGVIIEVDRAKLSNNYRIVPFNYFSKERNAARLPASGILASMTNQYEESVDRPIKDPLRYIRVLHMTQRSKEKFEERYPDLYSKIQDYISIKRLSND